MKKLIIALIIAVLSISTPVKACEVYTAKATAYCITGETATGTQTVEGRTVAGKREWFGKTMIMYEDDGDGYIKPENYIGTYIVEDTGGEPVRKGYVIDVYLELYEDCVNWGCKDVIILIVESEG